MEFVWVTDGGVHHLSLPDIVWDIFPDAIVHRVQSLDRLPSAVRRGAPALIFVDYDFGAASVSRIRNRLPNVPVLILFGKPLVMEALAALDAGAAGYVPDTMSGEGLKLVIKLVLSGERYVPALAIDGWRSAEGARTPQAADGSRVGMLTPRQREVLGLVARGSSNKEVARELAMCELTVKSHMRAIFRTLGVSSRTEAARTALLTGIGFVPEMPGADKEHSDN